MQPYEIAQLSKEELLKIPQLQTLVTSFRFKAVSKVKCNKYSHYDYEDCDNVIMCHYNGTFGLAEIAGAHILGSYTCTAKILDTLGIGVLAPEYSIEDKSCRALALYQDFVDESMAMYKENPKSIYPSELYTEEKVDDYNERMEHEHKPQRKEYVLLQVSVEEALEMIGAMYLSPQDTWAVRCLIEQADNDGCIPQIYPITEIGRAYEEGKNVLVQTLPKYLREILFKEKIELDLENCHSNIIEAACNKAGVSVPTVSEYNANPVEFRQATAEELGITAKQAKTSFAALVCGKAISTIEAEYGIVIPKDSRIRKFARDVRTFIKVIRDDAKFLSIKKECTHKGHTNLFRAVALWLQTVETKIMLRARQLIDAKGGNVGAWIFDAFILNKYISREDVQIVGAILTREFGINIKFKYRVLGDTETMDKDSDTYAKFMDITRKMAEWRAKKADEAKTA